MKGIILAGGSGTRLYPLTVSVSKQLLPVYDKPMVYYPLSTLMLAGIRDILLISTPKDLPSFKRLLGDGGAFGINIDYAEQPKPEGLAQAFHIGKDFVGDDPVCLILGDNLFYGAGMVKQLKQAVKIVEKENKAVIFGYYVNDPERYGVAVFDEKGNVTDIEEKPENPKSNVAVTGLYFYPSDVIEKSFQIEPSARGELEITDVNNLFLKEKRLKINVLGRGYAWLDTGTHEALSEATEFIKVIEKRTGLKIGSPEEIAYHNGWKSAEELWKNVKDLKGEYYLYLQRMLKNHTP